MDDDMIPVISRLACGLIYNRPQPWHSSQLSSCSLHVKLWDYSNVEGRIVCSLDHSCYVAFRTLTFIGAKGWVGKVRYLLRRPEHTLWTYQKTLLSTHGWCQLLAWFHNSTHVDSLTTAMYDVIKSKSHGLYRTVWTLAIFHSHAPGNVNFWALWWSESRNGRTGACW